jgi:hypothetical protein
MLFPQELQTQICLYTDLWEDDSMIFEPSLCAAALSPFPENPQPRR